MPFMPSRSARRNRPLIFLSVLLVGLVVAVALGAALLLALLPAGDRTAVEGRASRRTAIFVTSYLALAIGKVPGLSIDRAGVALVGACPDGGLRRPVAGGGVSGRSTWAPSRCCSA